VNRVLVWFSAGAASAVAAKLALRDAGDREVAIAYSNPGSEHEDNDRFVEDCERWLARPVTRLRSSKYVDTWQVWEERRYLNGPAGALCTTELKKALRFEFERPGDVQVFGDTIEEQRRADRFRANNPDVTLWCPLIDEGLRKSDCLAIIERAGIRQQQLRRLRQGRRRLLETRSAATFLVCSAGWRRSSAISARRASMGSSSTSSNRPRAVIQTNPIWIARCSARQRPTN
jgi:PP-loop superfamily ATP-utilizing enzyme